jgi:Domain of unknown function (DUF3854)
LDGLSTIPPAPPDWGVPLHESDYASLSSSWITPEIADAAMLRRVGAEEGRQIVGQKGRIDCAGLLIPYYWPGEQLPFCYRIRRDRPDWTGSASGQLKQDRKYLGAPGSANRLYVPPGIAVEQLQNSDLPLVIVEGEKKCLALLRLASHQATNPRFLPIAIAGVWNWRGKTGKGIGPNGERIDIRGPITDLDRVAWKDRTAYILFDSNVNSNDGVKWARNGLNRELATRHAKVQLITLPDDCGVNGVDDLLALSGPDRVLALFETSTSGKRLQVVKSPQFQYRQEGMFRVTAKGEQLVETQLTNYQASITKSVRLDDGVETRSEFEIAAELMGRKAEFTIPATQFSCMDWPIEQMGPSAITYPNQREYARTAIQSASFEAAFHSIYAHTGWRKIDGSRVYLHAGGAIGATGPVAGVEVRLPGALERYRLDISSTAEDLASSVRASLLLTELGPASVSFPLRAATCRSVLGESDFSVHLVGESGAFKSELAALEQQFFGAGMNRVNLPGTWSSTANAIEGLCFHAKDSIIVVDDFAPHGNAADVNRYHGAADRLFRAAGNGSGRGRMDSTARLRESKPPRGLILSTGEDIPRGHSVRARLLILEISKGYINPNKLSECQKAAESGAYARAMAGYLQWLAGHYDESLQAFNERRTCLRSNPLNQSAHARTPGIVANLQAAFEIYLEFAEQCGAIGHDVRNDLMQRCAVGLADAASVQCRHQLPAEPAEKFLSLLRSCLSSGRAHLSSPKGMIPDFSPSDCGWRQDGERVSALGECVGWIDATNIYVDPSAAYRVVQATGRDTGDGLAVTEQTLRKRLGEKGLLASVGEKRETLTIRKKIGGSSKSVLHFLRTTILPEADDEEDQDVG